jgi:hypothetical protein
MADAAAASLAAGQRRSRQRRPRRLRLGLGGASGVVGHELYRAGRRAAAGAAGDLRPLAARGGSQAA